MSDERVPGSDPDELLDEAGRARRRFLRLVAMGVGAGLTGSALVEAVASQVPGLSTDVAAAALGPHEGILIVIGMYGGNDGFNTVIPIADAAYRAQRGSLAIDARTALRLNQTTGLHPALGTLKREWDAGRLAIVEGVGLPDPDLSHFTSMAHWMSGHATGVGVGSGWIGRWLDAKPGGRTNADLGVSIGSQVPLNMIGRERRAVSIPTGSPGFGGGIEPADQRLYGAVHAMAAPGARGRWDAALSGALRDQVDLAGRLRTVLDKPAPGPLAGQLDAVARLINADLGMRVFDASWGGFDSHAGQPWMHTARMQEFDAGIKRFFEVLDPRWAGRVALMTFSEFGRTSHANGSDGTDHGTASCALVVGAGVRGGMYGQRPALTGLGRWDRPAYHVDARSYYASLLDGWLGGGSTEVLGRPYEDLKLFGSSPKSG